MIDRCLSDPYLVDFRANVETLHPVAAKRALTATFGRARCEALLASITFLV